MKAFSHRSKNGLSFRAAIRGQAEETDEKKDAEAGSELNNEDSENPSSQDTLPRNTPEPGADEEEDAFISRCMKEVSSNPDRTNEQNVAICYRAWKDKDKAKDQVKAKVKAEDASDETDKATEEEQQVAAELETEPEPEKRVLDLTVYGEIGAPEEGEEEASAAFARMLSEAGELDEVNMYVNSAGGDIFSALAIVNQLRAKGAHTRAYVDGLAASAASVLAVSADETIMRSGAMLMIHNAWSAAIGDKDTMRTAASQLEKVDQTIAKMYAAASEKTEEEVEGLMNDETWLSDQEAVEEGFADRVEGRVKAERINNRLVYNSLSFDLSRYKTRPKNFDLLPVRAPLQQKEPKKGLSAQITIQKSQKSDPKLLETAKKEAILAERKRVAELDSMKNEEIASLVAAAKADGRTKAEILGEAFEIMAAVKAPTSAAAYLAKRALETKNARTINVSPAEIITPSTESRKKAEVEEAVALIAGANRKATPPVSGNSQKR